MIRFLLGFFAVLLAVTGWVFVGAVMNGRGNTGAIVITLAVVPTLAAWAALELACIRRPRKLFDRRRRRPWRAAALGAITGVPVLIVLAVLVAFLADHVPTPLIGGAATLLVVSVIAWCLPVVRPHACAGCDYDLRGVWGVSRCPECGRSLGGAQSAVTATR